MATNKPVAKIPSSDDDRPVKIWNFDDPTAAREGIDILHQDAVQLELEPLKVRRVMVDLDGLAVIFHSTNRRLRTRTRIQSPVVAIVAIGPGANVTLDGVEVPADGLIASEPGAEAELVVEAGYESITVMLPPDHLLGHFEQRGRAEQFPLPRGAEIRRPSRLGTGRLFNLGKRLTAEAARNPEKFELRAVRAAAHTQIVETLVGTLSTNDSVPPLTRHDRTSHAQSQIVKKATEHALERVGDRIYVADLCKVAGVSERSLQYAFRQILSLAPITYLNRLRLHRVREELRNAAASTTVTDVATNWGFWHFGDFSRAYKLCFDERPSDTLSNRKRA